MKKSLVTAIAVIVIAIIGGSIYWLSQTAPGPAGEKETTRAPEQDRDQVSDRDRKAEKVEKKSAAERYCADDHDKSHMASLDDDGGLIHLFEHADEVDNAYDCAAEYLDHEGDINAERRVGDSRPTTPLFHAIKENDPKMVQFMLDHGADPKQRVDIGDKKMRAYGFAVYQAIHHKGDNYNPVIEAIDDAMEE